MVLIVVVILVAVVMVVHTHTRTQYTPRTVVSMCTVLPPLVFLGEASVESRRAPAGSINKSQEQ